MRLIERGLSLIFRISTGIAFLTLILTVLIQVTGRTIGISPVWTEELTRFALLYMVAFGAGPALLTSELVNVDFVCNRFPAPWPKRLQIVSSLATLALAVVLAEPAWRFTSIGKMQTSPALGTRMDFSHATVLVLSLSLGIFAALRIVTPFLAPRDTDHNTRHGVN